MQTTTAYMLCARQIVRLQRALHWGCGSIAADNVFIYNRVAAFSADQVIEPGLMQTAFWKRICGLLSLV